MTKISNCLEFDHWNLFVIWCLEFGIFRQDLPIKLRIRGSMFLLKLC